MWTKKSFRDKRIETFELITVAVCCGYVSNLIGRRTINIPEIIFGVHASSVSTVISKLTKLVHDLLKATGKLLQIKKKSSEDSQKNLGNYCY